MKKTIKLMLALVAVLSLFATACGSDSITDVASDAVDTATDAAGDAADAAGDAVEAVEDAMDDEDAMEEEDHSDDAMDEEDDIVLAVGFLFAGDAAAAATANPDVNFAVIDDAMMDFETFTPVADNAAGLTFAEEQGSFLVGAAAALKSETGKVGFIGGVCCFGLIEKFEAGFRAGAQAVDPDIEIVAQYITDAPDFDGFNQPDQAKVIATTMYGWCG